MYVGIPTKARQSEGESSGLGILPTRRVELCTMPGDIWQTPFVDCTGKETGTDEFFEMSAASK